jgi:diazepam-binding inhibitor (GABA receptor modulator, acyl-CoA-binding protein)
LKETVEGLVLQWGKVKEEKMQSLKDRFEIASQEARRLSKPPDNDTLLRLYALYKQATAGDASGKRPGMFDMVGRAKYDAWAALKGTTQAEAMESYVILVDELKEESGLLKQ